ncbi:MAG: hypothetical protein AB9903_14815 [Vulcanimicrobiota bacterium]
MTFLPYTPMRADYDELERTSVGREPIIGEILKDIDRQSTLKSHQHWILVGSRGIGKSHALELIYRRIGRDQKRLSKWLPVKFPEEGHGIVTLWDFFRHLIELAIGELERENADSSSHRTFQNKYEKEVDQRYAVEMARAFLTDEFNRTGRKYLLFLENLHRIIGNRITVDKRDEHFLRSLLMEDDSLLLIGTSLNFFDKIADSRSALYGLFRTEVLEELSLDEAKNFLVKRCDFDGNTVLSQKIIKSENSVRGLYTLAGGSPRMLLMLYRIASGINDTVKIEREFYSLLEDMTAYFESRLDQLTPQQEKILIAFTEGSYKMTPIEISKLTSIEQRTVASQIIRLVNSGFLKREKLQDGRSTPYRLTEEIFRYWHQWRSMPGKRKLSIIVEFIALWYTRDELLEELQRLYDRNNMAQPDECEHKNKLLYLLEEAVEKQRAKDMEELDQDRIKVFLDEKQYDDAISYLLALAKDLPGNARIPLEIGKIYSTFKKEYENSLCHYKKAIKIDGGLHDAYFGEGNALARLGQIKNDEKLYKKACEKYRKVLKIKPDNYRALNNWGNTLSELAKLNNDEKYYREAFSKYLQATEIKTDFHTFYDWGIALFELAHIKSDDKLYNECFEKYQKALEIKPDSYEAFHNWGYFLLEFARIRVDDKLYAEACEKLQKATEIKPDAHVAFLDWGNALSEAAGIKKNDRLYNEAFQKYQKATEIKSDYHEAFNNWGKALIDLAHVNFDDKLYNEAFQKYQKATEIKPDKERAFFNWGKAISELAQIRKDETLYRKAFEKYQKAIEINPSFYMAFVNWGSALYALAMLKKDLNLFLESSEKCGKAVEIKYDGLEAFNNWGNALLGLALLKKEENLFMESAEKYYSCWKIYRKTKHEFHPIYLNAALLASRLFLIYGKEKKSDYIFSEILKTVEKEEDIDSLRPLFYQFFLEIIKAKKYKEARQLLEAVQKSKFSRTFEFLFFFEHLIQYLSAGDELSLKTQPPELQKVLIEMREEAKQIEGSLHNHPDYLCDLRIDDKDIDLSLSPRRPGTSIPPIKICTTCLEVSSVISDTESSSMMIGSMGTMYLSPLKLEATSTDGEIVTIDYIAMKRIRVSSDAIEAGNIGQNIPLSLLITLSIPKKTGDLKISVNHAGFRPLQILKCAQFLRALERGGSLRVIMLESGESTGSMQINNIERETMSDDWLDLLRRMILIEEKTGTKLILPEKFTEVDNTTLEEFESIIEKGLVKSLADKVTLKLPIDTVRRLLELNRPGEYCHVRLAFDESEKELFGVKIPLGPTSCSFEGRLRQSNEELSAAIEETRESNVVAADFEVKDSRIEFKYINWLPGGASAVPEILKKN